MVWEEYAIGETVEVSGGGTPDTENNDYWDGDVLWLTPTEASNASSRFVNDTKRRITDAGLKNSAARLMPAGTILLTSRATIGDVVINTKPMATNQGFINIVCNNEFVLTEYFFYWLKVHKELILAYANGATFLEISKSEFKKIKIKLPPLPVQRRIAQVLGRYDALIENYAAQIRTLEAVAQNLYREWFVRHRINGGELPIDENTKLPVGWEEIKIGDVCIIARGSSPRPINDNIYFENGTIPWIKIADATAAGKFLFQTKEHVNEYGASFSRYLNKGSLIIATSGTLGFCVLLGVKGCVHDGWLYISGYKKDVTPNFMFFVINSLTEYFNNRSYGAAIQNINSDILRETPMLLPPKEILDKFQKIIVPIDEKIYNLSRQISNLREMRDKLLPRLLSGKLEIQSA